jgi:DNA-binding transcriptional MocR family regulator
MPAIPDGAPHEYQPAPRVARSGFARRRARLIQEGIAVRPLSLHFVGRVGDRGLFLGFAAWNNREIEKGAEKIGAVLRRYGY